MSKCARGTNYAVSIPYLTGMNGKLIGQVFPAKLFSNTKKTTQKGKAKSQGGKRKIRRKSRKKSQKKRKILEDADN